MAGLIKGQILKHLSKFVRNLAPSQINLSTLKGEGELTNLELNTEVLTELLELPAWVRLVQATCNRAAIRIQWTKLKTVPIQLSLDEIRVRVETCEELRTEGGGRVAHTLPQAGTGAYGFTDKVVDGISMSVNLVHVTLTSLAFTASFQMSRIVVESKTPSWQRASLPLTRLKDVERGEVLIFKELSWQTVRIEARSTVAEDLTPLRLITNQARCRITLKKRMTDSAILGCRLVVILDDLLWVLTDDQLKAALHFVDSVSGLVKKATEKTQKVKAARKLENQTKGPMGPAERGTRRSGGPVSPGSRTFQRYDVTETSYHFYSDRIDLHFCDDPGGGRSDHPELAGGGAFQVSLARLQLDYYPYHLARGDRKHWVRYNDQTVTHRSWLQANLAQFDTRLLDVLLAGQNKTPLSRAGRGGGRTDQGGQHSTGGEDGLRDLVVSQLSRVMTTNVVVRLADLTLWRVSTSSSPTGSKTSSQPLELLRGDCARLHLPPDLPLLHAEFSQFYYPGDLDFPLPPPCLLVTANPVTAWLDVLTLVWLNAFSLNLQKSVMSLQQSLQLEEGDAAYADVKVELVMPRLICSPRHASTSHEQKPTGLQLSASKVALANYRSIETGSRADLAAALDKFQQSSLFFGAGFPSRTEDPAVVDTKFVAHATGQDTVRESPTSLNSPGGGFAFKKDLLWTDARDVWHVAVDSAWAEFSVPCSPNRPIPLLDATPLTAWVYAKPDKPVKPASPRGQVTEQTERPNRKLLSDFYGSVDEEGGQQSQDVGGQQCQDVGVHVLVLASQLVSLQLDHHQLLFLLRLADSLGEMGAFLASDSKRIVTNPPGMVVGAVLPQVDVSVILPVARDGQTTKVLVEETTSLDVESVNESVVQPLEEQPRDQSLEPDPVIQSLSEQGDHTQLCPVTDHSDPLNCDNSTRSHNSSQASKPMVEETTPTRPPDPPVKLQLVPSLSNGLKANAKTRGLTSSFNSMLDGLGAYTGYKTSGDPHLGLPPGGGSRSPDIDIDSLSMRSDDSGESNWDTEGFVVLGETSDVSEVLFRVDRGDVSGSDLRGTSPAEMAEEVCEELPAGGSIDSGGEVERLVSVLTLHLGRLALAQLSGQQVSSILLTADSLALQEGHVQDYHQFQFRFGQSGKAWSESTLVSQSGVSAVQLRLESQPPAQPGQALSDLPSDLDISIGEKIARVTDGRVDIAVAGIALSLVTSTLTRLGEWAQDEVLATPLPLSLKLSDVRLHLTDDAIPPPGCPPPPPVDLSVPRLTLTRDRQGTFSVSSTPDNTETFVPDTKQEDKEADLRSQLETALAEVRILRSKLAEVERRRVDGEERNKELEVRQGQSSRQVVALVEEKKSLLDTLRYLQEELLKSGKK